MKINPTTHFCLTISLLFLQTQPIYTQATAAATASPTPPTTSPTVAAQPEEKKCTLLTNPGTQSEDETGGVKVKLYYLREATKIRALLDAIAKPKGSDLECLIMSNVTEDELILYGAKRKRDHARRIIAALDLPRPGINMEMWGIQISSRDPQKMAEVMIEIRGVINKTQYDVRETYNRLQEYVRGAIPDNALNHQFKDLLEKDLQYTTALHADRSLSITDVLLRMIAAENPSQAAKDIALRINSDSVVNEYAAIMPTKTRRPFERFLHTRGLYYENNNWVEKNDSVRTNALQGQTALLDFGLHYARMVHQPNKFSPYYLQQSTEILNYRLQNAIDALNADMEDLFVLPTLNRIRAIVSKFKDVEYAQVGKTSAASLSGIPTEVSSSSVSAFDVTPPLRLSELLTKADTLSQSVGKFDPAANVVGALPLSQVVGLIAAFGEERSVWRELKAGVSITVTPNVLRNMNSAELQIYLKTGDPQAGTRESGVRPLSRVSQHDVKTSVYVNALDFFDLSAFTNQSTLNGGRGYVPIIGPIWRGVFSDVPIFGNLFSWKKDAQTVYHESLVLTNSLITPTVMGVALLYPTESLEANRGTRQAFTEDHFKAQEQKIEEYKSKLFEKNNPQIEKITGKQP